MSRLSAVTAMVMAIPVCAADPAPHTAQPAGDEVVGKNATPSFLNDVVPILTRQGCNQGACHGKGDGQNGFRLSLRGYAPENDHRWITPEFNGRWLERASRKVCYPQPTDASHEGGRVFSTDSREYRVILEWLKAGAPDRRRTTKR